MISNLIVGIPIGKFVKTLDFQKQKITLYVAKE